MKTSFAVLIFSDDSTAVAHTTNTLVEPTVHRVFSVSEAVDKNDT